METDFKMTEEKKELKFTDEEIERFKEQQTELKEFLDRTENEKRIRNAIFDIKKNNNDMVDGKPKFLSLPEYYNLLFELEELQMIKTNYFLDEEIMKLEVRIESFEPVFKQHEAAKVEVKE